MTKKYNSVLIIGMGLIGSSISRALVENHVANGVYGLDTNAVSYTHLTLPTKA